MHRQLSVTEGGRGSYAINYSSECPTHDRGVGSGLKSSNPSLVARAGAGGRKGWYRGTGNWDGMGWHPPECHQGHRMLLHHEEGIRGVSGQDIAATGSVVVTAQTFVRGWDTVGSLISSQEYLHTGLANYIFYSLTI